MKYHGRPGIPDAADARGAEDRECGSRRESPWAVAFAHCEHPVVL